MNEFPRYAIAIFPDDEDGDYIAIVPDLRGCSAFGDTGEKYLLHEVVVEIERLMAAPPTRQETVSVWEYAESA